MKTTKIKKNILWINKYFKVSVVVLLGTVKKTERNNECLNFFRINSEKFTLSINTREYLVFEFNNQDLHESFFFSSLLLQNLIRIFEQLKDESLENFIYNTKADEWTFKKRSYKPYDYFLKTIDKKNNLKIQVDLNNNNNRDGLVPLYSFKISDYFYMDLEEEDFFNLFYFLKSFDLLNYSASLVSIALSNSSKYEMNEQDFKRKPPTALYIQSIETLIEGMTDKEFSGWCKEQNIEINLSEFTNLEEAKFYTIADFKKTS